MTSIEFFFLFGAQIILEVGSTFRFEQLSPSSGNKSLEYELHE
jgi:hypothetical protein